MTTYADTLTRWVAHELQSRTGFRWDRGIARYRDNATGRLVSERQVFAAAEGFREFTKQNIAGHTDRFINGGIDLPTWQRRVAAEVKDAHIVAHMAGRGGRNAMTQQDWGQVGGRLQFQYRKLDEFAIKIKVGMLSEAQIQANAELYGERATQAYNDGVMTANQEAGNNLRWVVGPTEHCGDCMRLNGQVHSAVAWASSGWQPQSQILECGGYRCQCKLVPTDEEESGSF